MNDPRNFWKAVQSLSAACDNTNELPPCIVKNAVTVSDKSEMLNCFNEHFISSGFLFNSVTPPEIESVNDNTVVLDHNFSFAPFSVSEVHKALKQLNPRKPTGPDLLEPGLLKLATDIIAEPLTHLFNLTLVSNVIPKVWKAAYGLF